MTSKRVLVAMSGGVDSSVAAALLQEQGYDCSGVFMCLSQAPVEGAGHHGCCSPIDAQDAREVASQLGMPFHVIDFQKDMEKLIDYFVDEYRQARTPNPCIQCNNWLKFGKLLEYAELTGADWVATGHYAQVGKYEGEWALSRGVDAHKDQSYVLFGLQRDILKRVMLPLGGFSKPEVREMARKYNLDRVSGKKDSQEICFVPDNDYAGLVERRQPQLIKTGDIVDAAGKVLGQHAGIHHFTIGQRRGLGVALGEPAYVVKIDACENRVVLGKVDELKKTRMQVSQVNWHGPEIPTEAFDCTVQIRYNHAGAAGAVALLPDDEGNLTRAEVMFNEPMTAIAPGQAAVFYEGDRVLGGGWIQGSE